MSSELIFVITIIFISLLNIVTLYLKKYMDFIVVVLPYTAMISLIYIENKNIYQGIEIVSFVLIFSVILYILISAMSMMLQRKNNLNIIIIGGFWLLYFLFISLGSVACFYLKGLLFGVISTMFSLSILTIVLFLLRRIIKGSEDFEN